MYNLLLIPTFSAELDPTARESAIRIIATAISALPATHGTLCAPTLPGVYNGGDVLCRAIFDNRASCEAALAHPAWAPAAALLADPSVVTHIDRVGYDGGKAGGASGGGLYRVALFCANVRPDAERLAAFGAETATMPDHVRNMRSWQLSTTDTASGTRPWTHVWEQEYDDLAGLNGSYMLHPVHWARVERWFDPEYVEHLVDTVLVHTFCAIDQPVIIA